MSIVKMSKLRIVGLEKEKEKILNEIFLSSCAHLVQTEKIEGTKEVTLSDEFENLETLKEQTLKVLKSLLKLTNKETNRIDLSFDDFLDQEKTFAENELLIKKINEFFEEISKNYNLILKHKAEILELVPKELKRAYVLSRKNLKEQKTSNITKQALDRIYFAILENEKNKNEKFDDLTFQKDNQNNLFLSLKLRKEDYESLLLEFENLNKVLELKSEQNGIYEIYFSFKYANQKFFKEYEQKVLNLKKQIEELEEKNIEIYNKILEFSEKTEVIEIFYDFLSYKIEKLLAEENLKTTNKTFVLDCYVPRDEKQKFKDMLQEKFKTVVVENLKITSKDSPPTKLKTSKVTKQADFVVDMYSVPKYNDVDPTWSVFLFFMIFFGFIVADVVYGIILVLIGYSIAHKMKENSGAKKLWKLIGTAGIFTIIWGFLFGSFLGFSSAQFAFLPNGIMPNPQTDPIRLLLICLLMGVFQIAFGYVMRGIRLFKEGQFCAGMINGFAWVLFLLGGVMASSKFLLDFFGLSVNENFYAFLGSIQFPGLVVMIVGLFVGIVFAGIGTKGFRKFTKSFSALYGIISLFSDILSYARLFGLLLSSAIIAQQFNAIALSVMNGVLGYIFGFLIMLVGHSFNIAMGALSAYIHDVRLQYVEYFGKFYEGDGIRFKPFGTELEFVRFKI